MNVSVCILAHHKPWLLTSSLISLLSQDDLDFELNIIYISGDIKKNSKLKTYEDIKSDTEEENKQITKEDKEILEILENFNFKYKIHYYENSHGLDSAAWYRYIKEKQWQKNDFSFFLMEGFIFTNESVISSFKKFAKNNNPDFIGAGFEKRFFPLQKFLNTFKQKKNLTSMDNLHMTMLGEIFDDFCKDENFRTVYDKWGQESKKYINGYTHYHLPTKNLNPIYKIIFYFNYIFIKKKFFNPFKKNIFISDIKNNRYLAPLSESVEKIYSYKNTNYHIDNYFTYACMCQHVFSKNFLNKFFIFLEKNNLFETTNKPFSASSLEIVWGLIPLSLGFNKWFFDGIYRPRKNFVNHRRIDENPKNIARLFNNFHSLVKVKNTKKSIKINFYNKKLNHNFKFLTKYFFF